MGGGGRDAGRVVATFVLIHSPLVGPATWHWVARELTRQGHRVTVPSISRGAVAGDWRTCVRLAVDQVGTQEDTVLVGHSGAGYLLPSLADEMAHPPTQLVFVDAGVPPVSGESALLPEDLLARLRTMADDGVLPPWSDWFGPGAIDSLVPDLDRRDAVVADLPRIPVSYFDARVPVPDGWSTATNGAYILLSDAYRPDAREAASLGWPVIELLGAHLDLVTRAEDVARVLAGLTTT